MSVQSSVSQDEGPLIKSQVNVSLRQSWTPPLSSSELHKSCGQPSPAQPRPATGVMITFLTAVEILQLHQDRKISIFSHSAGQTERENVDLYDSLLSSVLPAWCQVQSLSLLSV